MGGRRGCVVDATVFLATIPAISFEAGVSFAPSIEISDARPFVIFILLPLLLSLLLSMFPPFSSAKSPLKLPQLAVLARLSRLRSHASWSARTCSSVTSNCG